MEKIAYLKYNISMSLESKTPFWQPAIIIFAQVTGWIAVPIIIALYVGRWLDNRYSSEPWLFIASMAVAFLISSIGIVRVTLGYIKKIEKEAREKKDKEEVSIKDQESSFKEVENNKY